MNRGRNIVKLEVKEYKIFSKLDVKKLKMPNRNFGGPKLYASPV